MVRTQPDNRPLVMLGLPCGSNGNIHTILSHCFFTGAKNRLHPVVAQGSAPNFNQNSLFADALMKHRAGIADYLLIHHVDCEIRTQRWLDIMVDEMKRTGAALLAGICAIKNIDAGGDSNMAVSGDDMWHNRRMKLQETWEMPETFSIKDTPWPDRMLLVNTGLLLIDLSRPEWWERNGDDLKFCFWDQHRIRVDENGDLHAQFYSEDWNFARMAAEAGLTVFATRKIQIIHHGEQGFDNWERSPEEAPPDLENEEKISVEMMNEELCHAAH